MTNDGKADECDVRVASHAERLADDDDNDSFPPEGTDDKTVQAADTGAVPFSDEEALKATHAVIDAGLSGGGKISPDWPNGQPSETPDDGNNKR